MGSQLHRVTSIRIIMKFFILASLLALAAAEADPQVFYNTYGYYPSWYTGYTGYTHQVAPVVYTQPKVQVQKVEPVEYKVQQPVTYTYPTVQTPVTYQVPRVYNNMYQYVHTPA